MAEETRKGKILHKLPMIILATACIMALIAAGIFYYLYTNATKDEAKQTEALARVQSIAETPTEKPVIVTVTNKDKLSNKQLAAKVENNDMLIFYSQAKRLVIYRPANQKIVDMLGFEGVNTNTIQK